MNSRIKVVVVLSSTFLVLLLLLGSMLGKGASNNDSTYRHLSVLTEVLHRIKSEYVEEPDMKNVTLGALNGLLESVDPFASYLNTDQYKEYLRNKEKERAGVGLILSKKFGYLGIVGVIPGSSAAKAGLSTGDMIESINNIATRDMPLAYSDLLLRGESGSTVDISVVRVRRSTEPQNTKLTRAQTAYPPVSARILHDEAGYVRPETLVPGKVKETATAIADLQRQGAKRIVLDLRSCSVGAPEQGIELANLFLDKGLITYLQGQRVSRQNFEADPAKIISRLPMVVLTNRGTADGAEVAAAALQDSRRAELVGEKTYGDASVQRAITMDDGGAIILSVAKYYSPSGKAIQDLGVTPGTILSEPESQVETDENGEPDTPEAEQPRKNEDDPLLKKALELLKSK